LVIFPNYSERIFTFFGFFRPSDSLGACILTIYCHTTHMSNFQGDIELERLANDSMQDWGDDFDPETVEQNVMEEHDEAQRDYPERFNSREEWDAYNEECDRHDLERAHLKGNDIDFGDLFDLSF